jgi:pimeloyl-ACP methyl ester carboxylesterase
LAEPALASALLVHGAGGGGWEWNAWRGVFAARGVDVETPDLQPARRGLDATTLDDYVGQVRSALESLRRPRVAVGASLGGLLVALASELADALVLVNPLPPAPFHASLPDRDWPDVVPWRREARLQSSRRALPDAAGAAVLYAFRRWRDESGAVLRAAHAGVVVPAPTCPALCLVSRDDEDVPPRATEALAAAWRATLVRSSASGHVAPLLGAAAAADAQTALAWLQSRLSPG